MAQNSVFEEYNDDANGSLGKLAQKTKDSPFVPIGKYYFNQILYNYKICVSISVINYFYWH